MRTIVVTLVLALTSTGLCAAAAADDGDLARKQFEQGIEFFEEGKFEEAATAFERAYELKPSYRILYNIAQTENELGHYAAALLAYTEYLAQGGDEISDERREQIQRETEKLNLRVGMLIIECPIEGALLKLDGEHKGESPFRGPVFVDLGRHEVVVTFRDEEIHEEVVRVAGNERVTVKVVVSEAERERMGAALVGGGDAPAEEEPQEEEPDEPPRRVWTWVALGVGAGAGIAGGVLGGVALSEKDELMSRCDDNICPEASDRDDKRRIQRLALSADIMYGLAAAGVIAGVVLFFVEPKMGEEDGEAAIVATPTAFEDGMGLVVGGRF